MSLFNREKNFLPFPISVHELEGKPVNDARPYGVLVRSVETTPGQPCWRVLHVHHMTPAENQDGHFIYVEVLNEEGRRVPGVEVQISWGGGEKIERVQAREDRPGIRFPMDRWSLYAVTLLGAPSERVIGLTASHPDEGRGNRAFHHSFLLVWQRAVAGEPAAVVPSPQEAQILPGSVEHPEAAELLDAETGGRETSSVQTATAETTTRESATAAEKSSYATTASAGSAQDTGPLAAKGQRLETGGTVPPESATPTPPIEPVTEVTSAGAAEVPGPEPSPAAVSEPKSSPPVPEPEITAPPSQGTSGGDTLPSTTPSLPLYVLFADGREHQILAAFFVILESLKKAGLPFGFDTWEAARHARRVIVVGQPDEKRLQHLRAEVEDVIVLQGETNTLKDQFEDALGVG